MSIKDRTIEAADDVRRFRVEAASRFRAITLLAAHRPCNRPPAGGPHRNDTGTQARRHARPMGEDAV